MSAPLRYRPEIDGLRAVAVAIVVLFHARLGMVSGVFVGVDVFFVISGFLIASVITAGRTSERSFSYLHFYDRRVRRLLPALVVVVVASGIAGAVFFTPSDYVAFARSAAAAIGFYSNLFFSKEAGYFMPAAEKLPLLHTWSLGVEEQFYLVAPFAILALGALPRRWRGVAFYLSFTVFLCLSVQGAWRGSPKAFYRPHFRAFELMIGVALALDLVPALVRRWQREAAAFAGLAAIAIAAFVYSPKTSFPGLAAALPCLGAALLIHSGGETLAGRLLSTRPLVFTGRISYSLYLWHWPLLAFATYRLGALPSVGGRAALIALAYALAVLTYAWVEQPVRRSKVLLTTPRVFAAGAVAIVAIMGAAVLIERSDGWPGRLPAEVIAFERTKAGPPGDPPHCAPDGSDCRIGSPSAAPAFILIGDSHANALAPMLSQIAAKRGMSGLAITQEGCPPLFEGGFLDAGIVDKRPCLPLQEALRRGLADKSVRAVILVSRWAYYAEALGYGSELDTAFRIPNSADRIASRAAFAASLEATVRQFLADGLHVVLVGPVPELGVDLPEAITRSLMWHQPFEFVLNEQDFRSRQAAVLPVLERLAALAGVTVLYPHEILCDGSVCDPRFAGEPLYQDDDHLSGYGALRIAPLLDKALDAAR
jgi:peptidoglycan/LPS O-acetylase OafA/YrhL